MTYSTPPDDSLSQTLTFTDVRTQPGKHPPKSWASLWRPHIQRREILSQHAPAAFQWHPASPRVLNWRPRSLGAMMQLSRRTELYFGVMLDAQRCTPEAALHRISVALTAHSAAVSGSKRPVLKCHAHRDTAQARRHRQLGWQWRLRLRRACHLRGRSTVAHPMDKAGRLSTYTS